MFMRPTRRQLLQSLAAAAPVAHATAADGPRPNVLIVLADDQGWGDLSATGNRNLATPNIDSLARDGATLQHFYVCPVCAPTRAEFLTGRYHARTGVRGVQDGDERLDLGETTIAEMFRRAGYATGLFGKWHNGSQFPYHPNARGFEEFYGFLSGHWGEYFNPELDHNGEPARGKGYLQDDLTNRAVNFMQQHGKQTQPFFCYLAFNTPHSPMQVPDRFYSKFAQAQPGMTSRDRAKEDISMTRAALAMCENIDWNVGRLLQALETARLSRDTVVIYFSDNGPNSWRWNGGMKGRKGSTDEGGVRAPFFIRWPGHIAAGAQIKPIAGAIDLLPTLTDLCRVPVSTTKPLDGVSLRPLLLGQPVSWRDRMIFSQQNSQVSVRTQRYRLDARGQLFDIENDGGQTRDISLTQPEEAAPLRDAVRKWSREMAPFLEPDRRPFSVGFSRRTVLPAADGKPHGGVERSSKFPNCSFFTHWKTHEDSMTWDIDVGTAEDYEASIYYTCPEANLGAVVALRFEGEQVSETITVAHDPPLHGMSDDRVTRTESYMKQFRQLRLGKLRLPKGRGTLTLEALTIPGQGVADIWSVVLKQSV